MTGSCCLAVCVLWSLSSAVCADVVRVAVAANFARTLGQLAEGFHADTGHELRMSSGSTGKHYAQIRNGAAFDVFLAADRARPARLEAEGVGVAGSRFTYAFGRLALWVPEATELGPPDEYLRTARPQRLAIANPRLAPYGVAAQQALRAWQLWEGLKPRLVSGENVAQAFQFVATGNAPAGLVALSHLRAARVPETAFRLIPGGLHQPIRQQALMLRRSEASEAFMAYLKGESAAALIRAAGYEVAGRQ